MGVIKNASDASDKKLMQHESNNNNNTTAGKAKNYLASWW